MIKSIGIAALNETKPLAPWKFERRDARPDDVVIQIKYCGVCHSDIHQARNEWGGSKFPMVPGHEIVGTVSAVGKKVRRFKVGDTVGVGCLVDSCRKCSSCREGLEQYCENGWVGTYNSLEKDGKSITYGGYSNNIVVNEKFVLRISKKLDLAAAAPLLCAGITTYSPLKQWKIKKGHKVGIVGLGGLGHMAVKFAVAMGAKVTVFTTSLHKMNDAKKLGATDVVVTKEPGFEQKYFAQFDFILDTVSASHNINPYLSMLKRDATMTVVGIPEKPPEVEPFQLIFKRRRLAGSLIGGIEETQEMLDFCAKKGIVSDIEMIQANKINEAFERTIKSDVKYRFVIDLSTLK